MNKYVRFVLIGLLLGAVVLGCSSPGSSSTYAVTYNANGATSGSAPTDSNRYQQGDSVTVLAPNTLEKFLYSYCDWNTKADGSGINCTAGATFLMGSADVTLYVLWIPNNLTFSSSGTSITITGFTTPPTGSLTIPEGITNISDSAFSDCASLTGITIPPSVTDIGKSAFSGCTSLTNATILSGIIYIRDRTFYGCTSLASVSIPNGVVDIGTSAFYGCTSLASIAIPSSVGFFWDSAFYGCTSLASINIPDSVIGIDRYAFYGCTSLHGVTIPSLVRNIWYGAFYNCSSLAAVYVQATTPPFVENDVFFNCAGTLNIHIPSGPDILTDYQRVWWEWASYIVSP